MAVSDYDVPKFFSSSTVKTCDLDPIPSSLVKECADVLKTSITNIINYSHKEGSFPNLLKLLMLLPFSKSQVWTKTF